MKLLILFLIALFWAIPSISTAPPPPYGDASINGVWVEANVFGNLSTAKASPLTAGKTILITNKQVVNNLTIPSDRLLRIEPSGMISVNAGKTLTVNGPLDTGLHQVFSGLGSVIFGNNVSSVQPEWWGGAGNNSTDNAYPLSKAAATGANIILNAGTYLTSEAVSLKSGVTLTGQGVDKTILKRKPNSKAFHLIRNADASNGNKNIAIRDITLDGNKLGQASTLGGVCVYLENVADPLVERIKAINANNTASSGLGAVGAIHFEKCSGPVARYCSISHSATEGLRYRFGSEGLAFKCTAMNNGLSGVATDRCDGTLISGGEYRNNGTTNVSLNGRNNKAIYVRSENPGSGHNCFTVGHQYANHFGDADGTIVENCIASNSDANGVVVQSSKNVQILRNTISNCLKRHILVTNGDCSGAVIQENVCTKGGNLDSIVVSPFDMVGDMKRVLGAISLIDGGSGYTSAPTVSFSGGGGSGATALATVAGGIVTNVIMQNEGWGYTSDPKVVISGGGGSGARAKVRSFVAYRNVKVCKNRVYKCNRKGIRLRGCYGFEIAGNEVFNNGKAIPSYGIHVEFYSPYGNKHGRIIDNTCYDNQNIKTQTFGIYIDNSAPDVDYIIVDGNNCYGNSQKQINYGNGKHIVIGRNFEMP